MKKFFTVIAAVLFAGSMMAATTMTCADAATAALSVSGNNVEYNNGEEIEVTGYVTDIAYSWANGTMSFWMADAADGGKVLEAYKCAIANEADAPKVTDKVKVTGKLTKYGTTPEFAQGCTCEILEVGEGPAVVEIDVTNCATAAEAALSVSGGFYNNGTEYTVTGYVTSIQNAWASGKMTFWMADAADGGNVLEAYKCAIANQEDAPNVGDKVSVTGKLTKYGTTPEFAEGCTCVIVERSNAPQNLGQKTIAEFLALKNAKDTCILRGAIANIVMDKNDATQYNKYGNFDLVDASGSVYIYGLLTPDGQAQQFREMGLNAGDSITVKALYNEYNGNPQVVNAILVEEEVVEDADVVFVMEDFVGLGTASTGSEVTVTKDGVTFHCDKAYGDGQYGVRCYQGGVITISAEEQIGKIVFEFGLEKTGGLDEEVVVNATSWTYTLPSQARMNKVKIYLGTAEEPEKPVYPENPEGVITCAEAAELAAAAADPDADNNKVEVQQVRVRGFVTFCYAASEGKQSAWIADDQKATAGTVQGYYLEVPEEVAKGDYVELDGTLVKYFKAGKDGKADEIILEVTNGTMTKIYPEAIENVVLTEKAQKVMIDGNIYIIRDGKMFNLQGAQVR